MLKRKITYLILIAAISVSSVLSGCSSFKRVSTEKQKKEFLQLQQQREEKLAEKMDEDRKRHEEIQTKETRKRMKQNKKKMKRIQKGKHPKTFFQRLFTKKPH